jgi:hypothetical protein
VSLSTAPLHRRLRSLRSRAAVRRWELRQLEHASGAWFRLARLLAFARSAWAIDETDVASLVATGYRPDAAGLDLEPPRRIFVIDEGCLRGLPSARRVALQATPELLAHPALALIPFDTSPGDRGPDGVGHRRS